jgi:hypothetical protein
LRIGVNVDFKKEYFTSIKIFEMSKLKGINIKKQLFADVARLIEESKQYVAQTVNTTLTFLYWKIGARINR